MSQKSHLGLELLVPGWITVTRWNSPWRMKMNKPTKRLPSGLQQQGLLPPEDERMLGCPTIERAFDVGCHRFDFGAYYLLEKVIIVHEHGWMQT
jgi:hypothetical protein